MQPMPTFKPKTKSSSRPMTNAERQQRWRDRHRGRKRKAVFAPPAPPARAASLPGPHSAAQVVAGAAGAVGGAIVRMSDPAAGKVIEMYGTCVRRLTPDQRLQLARLIFDGLAAAAPVPPASAASAAGAALRTAA